MRRLLEQGASPWTLGLRVGLVSEAQALLLRTPRGLLKGAAWVRTPVRDLRSCWSQSWNVWPLSPLSREAGPLGWSPGAGVRGP